MIADRSSLLSLVSNERAAAAVEMAMITPMLIILMFGSMELGNFFLKQHVVSKQVRDGARYASRMTLSSAYSCPGTVFEDGGANTKIINVTKTGSVDGTATGRYSAAFWTSCTNGGAPVTVSVRCVSKDLYGGIYNGLDGDIPVAKVSAEVKYPSLFNAVGFNTGSLCLRAESEAAVAGL